MQRIAVAALLVCVGTTGALAQITIDGVKSPSELSSRYGAPKFIQSLPTSLGDNRNDLCASVGAGVGWALNNSNTGGVGGGDVVFDSSDPQYAAALAVTTGYEVRIPLSQLGNPTGTIKLAGYVGNGGGNYCSNQFIGGFGLTLPASRGNLGGDGSGGFTGSLGGVDLSAQPGDQFISIPFSAAAVTAPTLDGTLDASFYGSALFVQNVPTGFGNGTDFFSPGYINGSEINAVYARVGTADVGSGAQPYLFIFVAGNIQTDNNFNGNRIQLFLDSGVAGGLNTLPGGLPIPGLGNSSGLKFDASFNATHSLSVAAGFSDVASDYRVQSVFGRLTGTPVGGALGTSAADAAGVGTGSVCPPDNYVSLGSEVNEVYSWIDLASKRLHVLVTGNVREGENLHMFFDAAPGGQNVLRSDNVVGGLPNYWEYLSGIGFDAGFAADYFLSFKFEDGINQVLDAQVLRTNGPAKFITGFAIEPLLDFHAFSKANIGSQVPFSNATSNANQGGGMSWNDGQSAANQFTSYAPREANRMITGYLALNGNVFAPDQATWDAFVTTGGLGVPAARSGEILGAALNRNEGGVRGVGDSAGDATTATHGVEFSISLRELGWNPGNKIRIAGFITNSSRTAIGNQVIGGLPAGSNANIVMTPAIDFSTIAGDQNVEVANCYADFNQSGTANIDDIFIYLNAWFAGSQAADTNIAEPGAPNIDDIFIFLNLWFAGCV
jgi:hypothetical protein